MNAPACTSRPFHSNVCVCVCVCVQPTHTSAHVPTCKLHGSPAVLLSSSSRSSASSPLFFQSLSVFSSQSVLFPFNDVLFCFCLVFRRSSVTSLSLFAVEHPRTPIPVVGFAYRHCCSHQPPSILCCTLGCTLVRLIVSRRHAYRPGTARFHRPARPIVSIKGHLAHPRINYYA